LASGAILDFELGSVAGVDTSDLIHVTGSDSLTVNGGIFNFSNAGSMKAGTYTLIDYLGTFSGSIDNMSIGSVPSGFRYSLVNNMPATSIDLVVSPLLLGDFNSNGIVDAADYVTWRKNVGQPVGTLPNDNTGLAIGDEQYNLWRSNFGTAPSGTSAALAAVPEPGGVCCSLLLAFMCGFYRFAGKDRFAKLG
jgi:hypothetical protein